MRVELHLAPNDPSLQTLRHAWLAAGTRFAGNTATLAREARTMHAALSGRDIPPTLLDALSLVPRVADLINDPDWALAPEQRRDFVGALAYFVDNDDLIPDDIGRYGYLDDAMVLRLAVQSSAQEWNEWNDYREFRGTHPELLGFDRDDWTRDGQALINAMVKNKNAHRPRADGDTPFERGYADLSHPAALFNVR